MHPNQIGQGLQQYFAFYNRERPLQSLDYQVPAEVHFASADTGPLSTLFLPISDFDNGVSLSMALAAGRPSSNRRLDPSKETSYGLYIATR